MDTAGVQTRTVACCLPLMLLGNMCKPEHAQMTSLDSIVCSLKFNLGFLTCRPHLLVYWFAMQFIQWTGNEEFDTPTNGPVSQHGIERPREKLPNNQSFL